MANNFAYIFVPKFQLGEVDSDFVKIFYTITIAAGLSEINISPKIIPPYCKVMMPRCFLSCTTFNNILYTIELLHVYAGSKRLSITISHSKKIKVNCSKFIMFCLGFYSKAMTTFLVVTDRV